MPSGVYTRTEKHRRTISEAMKGNQNTRGYKHSDEARRKMSEARMGNQYARVSQEKDLEE